MYFNQKIMKTGRIIWGIVLIYIGIVFLLQNFGIIYFSWWRLWKLWPVLLIMFGINILFAKQTVKNNVLSALVTLASLVLLTFLAAKKTTGIDYKFPFNFNPDAETGYMYDQSESRYSEEYNKTLKTARLVVKSGSGDFELKNSTSKLFEAKINNGSVNYLLRRSDGDSTVNLNFLYKSGNGATFPEDIVHDAEIYLNENPVWDILLQTQAEEMDVDLSKFKVSRLVLTGQNSDLELKLGNLTEQLEVDVQQGIVAVKIKIPKHTGCRIVGSGELISSQFPDFTEIEPGIYETKNYQSSQKQINIALNKETNNVEIERY